MCGTLHDSKGWYFPGEGWQLTCVFFLYYKTEFFIALIFRWFSKSNKVFLNWRIDKIQDLFDNGFVVIKKKD